MSRYGVMTADRDFIFKLCMTADLPNEKLRIMADTFEKEGLNEQAERIRARIRKVETCEQ